MYPQTKIIFFLETPINPKNDVIYGKKKLEIPAAPLYHEQNRFSKNIMFQQASLGLERPGYIFLREESLLLTAT